MKTIEEVAKKIFHNMIEGKIGQWDHNEELWEIYCPIEKTQISCDLSGNDNISEIRFEIMMLIHDFFEEQEMLSYSEVVVRGNELIVDFVEV